MVSIKLERAEALRQNKIPVGLTVIIVTLTITSRTNNIVFMLILGVRSVPMSLVLGLFSEFHLSSQVRFL